MSSNDSSSWAYQMAHSLAHAEMMLDMDKQDFDARQARVNELRTGDRVARCRAANPVDAGSNPVLCSKIKPEDVDPVNGDYGPWLRSGRGNHVPDHLE